MSDAVVVFHPKDPSRLEPLLDLDEDSEDSPLPYAEKVGDAYLVYTFLPFADFTEAPESFGEWLEPFYAELDAVHDDPTGLFVFPDDFEPEAESYAGIVEELGEHGVFFQPQLEDGSLDDTSLDDASLADVEAVAQRLLQSLEGGKLDSFDLGQAITSVQSQLAEAFGIQLEPPSAPKSKANGDDPME